MSEKKKNKRSRQGIKWKMYVILIVFVGFAVGMVWFFPIRMMSYFYQANKSNEFEKISLEISSELDNTVGAESVVKKLSKEYAENIWVCKIHRGTPKVIISAIESGGVIENKVALNLSQLYDAALENENTYIALFAQNNYEIDSKLNVIKDNMGEPNVFPYMSSNAEPLRAVYVSIKTVGRDSYMIVQSASLTPMTSVVNMMRDQFLWIGIIIGILTLVMTGILSNVITKPIEKINESAKKLASGEYDIDFSINGYREIEELGDTLDYAAKELAVTSRLQRDLISNVSHDLRTPLTMIKGYAEVMRDVPGENTAENIQIIIDETSRLSELVNDMLDLSKIQSGTRKPELMYFSITQTVRETMQRYERLIMQQGYTVDFSADEDAWVYADRGMILQAVYNLINNAINYSGDDKIVRVTQIIDNNKVRINVSDNGEGIPEEELSVIWDRYYRANKTHRRATVGTGLGLSIVKEVLDVHGATYGVESSVGKGSTFWFELDIHSEDEMLGISEGYIEADYEHQGKGSNEN